MTNTSDKTVRDIERGPGSPGGPPKDSGARPGSPGFDLDRAVKLAAIALVVLAVLFGAYYYFDRYVSIGDESPLDMGVEELEEAVREDPANPDTRLALAEVYIATNRYADAIDQAEDVLDQFPDSDRALLVLGIAYEASGETESAIESLSAFVDLRKDSEMAHVDTTLEAAYFYLGRSYLALGRPAEAAAALEAAVAISPGDADAMHQAGLAFQALGDHDRALQYFERATTFVPVFAEVYEAMEGTYGDLGNSDGVRYAVAMQLYSAGQYGEALEQLLEVTASLPDFAPGFLGLALTYEQLGEFDAGLVAAQHALDLRSNNYLAAEQTFGRLAQHAGGSG